MTQQTPHSIMIEVQHPPIDCSARAYLVSVLHSGPCPGHRDCSASLPLLLRLK
jgi:hypothetical protein